MHVLKTCIFLTTSDTYYGQTLIAIFLVSNYPKGKDYCQF